MADSEKRYLSVEDILGAVDVTEEDFAVPEWGGTVRLRNITVEEQDEWRRKSRNGDDVDQRRAQGLLIVRSIIAPELTEDRLGQLEKKSARAWNRVLRRCLEINGLSEEEGSEKRAGSFPEGPA